ncbi:MAG TPA: isocitrate lyase/phosphoenolpyruvate mutase family protein, partial [Anaerolineales bacterium]|nr:isocitrate lyase/phosphoenolpyruvate mutase family protein [Anaerolineales bacterium]
ARAMAASVAIPLAGDLENGFGHEPDAAALTIRQAADAGLVGGSIEDASNDPAHPIYDFNHAVERVTAAVEAARSLPFGFTFTARAENFLHDRPDLDDTIRRLQAFERAGADVLFAPGLPGLEAVRTVCSAVAKPVNFMVGIRGASFTVAELEDAGVKRISLSTSLFRAAMSGLIAAAREAHEQGTFTYLDRILVTDEIDQIMRTP